MSHQYNANSFSIAKNARNFVKSVIDYEDHSKSPPTVLSGKTVYEKITYGIFLDLMGYGINYKDIQTEHILVSGGNILLSNVMFGVNEMYRYYVKLVSSKIKNNINLREKKYFYYPLLCDGEQVDIEISKRMREWFYLFNFTDISAEHDLNVDFRNIAIDYAIRFLAYKNILNFTSCNFYSQNTVFYKGRDVIIEGIEFQMRLLTTEKSSRKRIKYLTKELKDIWINGI